MDVLVRVLMVLVFLSALADCYLTNECLKLPGIIEANPVMAFLQRLLKGKWVLARLALTLLSIAAAVRAQPAWIGAAAMAVALGLNLWAVWNNWRVLRNSKGL